MWKQYTKFQYPRFIPVSNLCFKSFICRFRRKKRTLFDVLCLTFNLLKPTGHVMHQEFNIQQLYALLILYLCVLYLSENKQRLVPYTT
jgi:hypothetical protein